jgi:hypothetical protein
LLSPLSRDINSTNMTSADSAKRVREVLGIPNIRSTGFVEALPFSVDDVTVGSETELQAAVAGGRETVDLPITIQESNYFTNIVRRVETGESPRRSVTALEQFLDSNGQNIWENSWVRFPMDRLSALARQVLEEDLLADKKQPQAGMRKDAAKFVCATQGGALVRVPISYLLKLSLAEVIASQPNLPSAIEETALRLMHHFLSDNTSPETVSFYVIPLQTERGSGRAVAKETAKRYLLSQLLVMYANRKFGLQANGQQALLYFSPHPPVRQRELNGCISDSFYRELFMSPCLSGWDNGEEKHAYMHLCHQVLSRSQLNAVAKLRDAGILGTNLVVLPSMSNISLANNGTHISLGSRKLTRRLESGNPSFTGVDEKYLGDLVIKIVEHFLPLFVGNYSAAPYRLDFCDFHPERVLGFLPHELDYTHLRMIWRRWKKKASLSMFGKPITPFGLEWLDRCLAAVFRMRGDFVPDFRLIDYPVAMMSTERNRGLDGSVGSEERLKKDLSDLGVFDSKMSLYLLYRLRAFAKVGFSGFEGRHYSLFHSIEGDMTHVVNLQQLITALAFKYVLQGKWTHQHIPDDPQTESERRQIFFGAAIGVPTFYVRENTGNIFLQDLLRRTRHVRYSRRYRGYLRAYNRQFCMTLADVLAQDAADLIEALGLEATMEDLKARLREPGKRSVAGSLTDSILHQLGTTSPLKVSAHDFNVAAETYYRTALRLKHIDEALRLLIEDIQDIERASGDMDQSCREALRHGFPDSNLHRFLLSLRSQVMSDNIGSADLERLILLIIVSTQHDMVRAKRFIGVTNNLDSDSTSVRGARHRKGLHGAPNWGQGDSPHLLGGSREGPSLVPGGHGATSIKPAWLHKL